MPRIQNTEIQLFKRDFNILYFPVNKQTLVQTHRRNLVF